MSEKSKSPLPKQVSAKATVTSNRRSVKKEATKAEKQLKLKGTGTIPRRRRRKLGLPFIRVSSERQLDLLGLALALFGLFLGLILFSISRSPFTESVYKVFDEFVGYGIYLLPLALIWIGGWLVLRKIDNIPAFTFKRAFGYVLAFLFLVVFVEVATRHGGWLGAWMETTLRALLGQAGMWIALVAWLLVALTLSFDLSISGIVAAGLYFLEDAVGSIGSAITSRKREHDAQWQPDDELPIEDGFIPIEEHFSGDAVPHPGEAAVEFGKPIRLEQNKIQWKLPQAKNLLEVGNPSKIDDQAIEDRINILESTLRSLGTPCKVVNVSKGPTVTQFGVEPLFIESRGGRMKVRVNKIASLADDLALALAAPRIRIQAPVPGHSFVGIEVPNSEMVMVTLRDIVESEEYLKKKKPLSFALGRDVSGQSVVVDLAGMPHLLIAGTTGSGKSVCVNAMLSCLLLNNTPDDLRLILVDPKRVELTGFNGIPHLLSNVIVETDRVLGALQWMSREMDKRYKTFSSVGARNIDDYNRKVQPQGIKKLPYIVVVVDELADLMMVAPEETEHTITRLAQLARATGIHLVLATQRPSVNVMTGLIKSNIPARVAFAVSSNVDSRVILDKPGAERLLGKGDMLYMDPSAAEPVRLQGVYVSDAELHNLVDFWTRQTPEGNPDQPTERVDAVGDNLPLKQTTFFPEDITAGPNNQDVLLPDAIEFVRRENKASVSMLQRKFRIGYTRASRLVETMEEQKVIGQPRDATGIRPVLDHGDEQAME